MIKRTIKEVIAVGGISFDVQEGEIFRLLGKNGTGKTTTVIVNILIQRSARPVWVC